MSLMDFPFHPIADGEDSDGQCTHCLNMFREEDLTAMKDVQNKQHYACPDCALELESDFEGDEE